jgi:hypothetical protein
MTLITASTLSVSEFAALIDASRDNFAPLSPCPRSASPELRGSPLRRFSGAPSSPRARARTPSPPPSFFQHQFHGLERCRGSPDVDYHRNSTRRGSASTEESTYSSAYTEESDDDEEQEQDDGIIWFGRRTPPCTYRTEQFRNWVEDAEPPCVSTTETVRIKNANGSRSAGALWSKLFVLWRVRRRVRSHVSSSTTPTASASHRTLSSALKPKHQSLHRRMRTSPS